MENRFLNLPFLIVLLWQGLFLSAAEAQTGGKPVKEQRVEVIIGLDVIKKVNFVPDPRVQIGNRELLEVQLIPQKGEVTLKGLKAGRTSLILRDEYGNIRARYLINVTATNQSKIVQELRSFFKNIEGLKIGLEGQHVFVGGKIIVPEDMGIVNYILAKPEYTGVLNLVELSEQTQRVIAKHMQNEIQANGMKNVIVRVVNKRFWLEGVVFSPGHKVMAERIAQAYLPDNIESLARRTGSVQTVGTKLSIIQNFILVNQKKRPTPAPKLIKITSQFVELSKDYSKIFGFKWTPLLSGDGGAISFGKTVSGGVTTKSNGTLSGTISNLFPKLAAAKGAGHARIVQSGVVIVQNSRPAKISKGSNLRFEVGTGEFTKTETDKSGFTLDVTPRVLQGEKIELRPLNISVSRRISDTEELENNINTSLVVKAKESAVVGGVAVDSDSTDYDRNPPGGETQVEGGAPLFSFLKSKSYTSNKSQFVVFITPEIIESASSGTEEIRRKFRRRRR